MKDSVKPPPATSGCTGIQLLSPSLQRGLRTTVADYGNQLDDLRATTTTSSKKTAVFDFDSFTLEAVRRRHDQPPSSSSGSFLHAASSSGGSPRSPSLSRASSRFTKAASYDRLTSLDGMETNSVRSADEYEWGSHRGTHLSSTPSYGYSQSVSSNNSSRYPVHNMSQLSGLSKRMSMASSTASGHRIQHRAEVVVRGWLQRRRGRVIKRWKAQYCVLKTDQKLCLYSNEDTVNGRLEGRFQLLRVTYNEKNSSFQVIGIGSNETPYKEEFRPLDDDGWRAWFQALREFFDAASLHEALDRMPELSLVPGVHALEDDDDEDDGVFAQEVEEMIMRPYAYGSGDRVSSSNTSSTTTTSSGNQPSSHHTGVPPSPELQSERRKTILFDPETMRYTTSHVPRSDLPEPPHAAGHPISGRASHRIINTRSKSSSIASSSSTGSVDPRLRRGPSSHLDSTTEGVAVDCPMIERDSHNAMAILEGRGSESAVSSSSGDGAFSWNHRP